MTKVYVVRAQDRDEYNATPVEYVVGVYATKASAQSAARRNDEMRPLGVERRFSFVEEQELRP